MEIPAEYLQALGLEVGNEVIIRVKDSKVIIYTLAHAIKRAQAMVRDYVPEGHSLAD